MPFIETADSRIYYEVYGSGFPVLLLAPGSHRSRIEKWALVAADNPGYRFDPRIALADQFQLIALDQRNAGQSRGAVEPDHGWHTFAADQMAVVDHLGIDRFHVFGCSIGGPSAMFLCEQAPSRVVATILQDAIGARESLPLANLEHYRLWAKDMKTERPDLDQEALEAFGRNLYDREFVFSVTRDFARNCQTPLLLLPGKDHIHPPEVSEEIARLAHHTEIERDWKQATPDRNLKRIRQFLAEHTPVA